jgi:hypothetical protein
MKRGLLLAALTLLLGCGGATPAAGVWLQIEAPLVVPEAADNLEVALKRQRDATQLYARKYPLDGRQFPATLFLSTANDDLVNEEALTAEVRIHKGEVLAAPWAQTEASFVLVRGETQPVILKVCDCP